MVPIDGELAEVPVGEMDRRLVLDGIGHAQPRRERGLDRGVLGHATAGRPRWRWPDWPDRWGSSAGRRSSRSAGRPARSGPCVRTGPARRPPRSPGRRVTGAGKVRRLVEVAHQRSSAVARSVNVRWPGVAELHLGQAELDAGLHLVLGVELADDRALEEEGVGLLHVVVRTARPGRIVAVWCPSCSAGAGSS